MFVYFLQEGGPYGPIKIGSSANPKARLKMLQTGNPRPLALLGYFRPVDERHYEKALHEQFKSINVNGEWFESSSALLLFIRQNCPTTPPVAKSNMTLVAIKIDPDTRKMIEELCVYFTALEGKTSRAAIIRKAIREGYTQYCSS